MITKITPKSRRATLAALADYHPKVDPWGGVSFSTATCRCIISTNGPRRSPSCVSIFSTVNCPPEKRLTEAWDLAKSVAATLNFPVNFSAAGRHISDTIHPR